MNIEDLAIGSVIANDSYAWIKHCANHWRLACNDPGSPASDFQMSEAIRMGATLLRVGPTMDPIGLLAKATAACNQATEEIERLNAELDRAIADRDSALDYGHFDLEQCRAEIARAAAS